MLLIAVAWLVRTRVIDDDATAGTSSRRVTVVCIDELKKFCMDVLAANGDVTLRFESANTTLEARGASPEAAGEIWITMRPFPEMVDRLRTQNRRQPAATTVESIASSPLVLVVANERAESLAIGCGQPVDWRCLGDAAGAAWSDLDPDAASGTVRPAFAPHPDSALGQLGVASAVLGFFDGSGIAPSDPALLTWSRGLRRATNPNTVAGSTAVSVIQTRSSAFDVAVGAAAELADPNDPRFTLVPVAPAVSVEVVAAVPAGTSLPGGFVADLRAAFVAAGWETSATATTSVSADDMLLIRRTWEDLQ